MRVAVYMGHLSHQHCQGLFDILCLTAGLTVSVLSAHALLTQRAGQSLFTGPCVAVLYP